MKPRTIISAATLLIFAGVAAGGLFLSGAFTSEASHGQATRVSLDMVASDDPSTAAVEVANTYVPSVDGNFDGLPDAGSNVMSIGPVENCFIHDEAGVATPHLHGFGGTNTTDAKVQFVIRTVNDAAGWQARLNLDGTKIDITAAGQVLHTPFSDGTVPLNFLNLPTDGTGAHKSVFGTQEFLNSGTANSTVLLGSAALGVDNVGVAPDVPSKSPHDEATRTYQANGGGVLAQIQFVVRAGQVGVTNIFDLDDGTPNTPGSKVDVFTTGGLVSHFFTEGELDDGFENEGSSTCVAGATPTATAVAPTATRTATPVAPTATPTATSVAPTATPTATPVGPTATPTVTPIGPTATPTATPVGPTATPTATAVGPTATPTATPVGPTDTPTATPVGPTATPTATSAVPTDTPTATPVGATSTPTPTATPEPVATATPTPTTTPISQPGLCQGLAPTISGTDGSDNITGTSRPDVIDGRGGNDRIRGLSGDDVICGGDGNDDIDGGSGNDTITGGNGNDDLEGGSGTDVISGGDDNDDIDGDSGHDVLNGDAGNDELEGGSGNDELFGGSGNDDLDGGPGADHLDGGPNNDACSGGPGADTETACED